MGGLAKSFASPHPLKLKFQAKEWHANSQNSDTNLRELRAKYLNIFITNSNGHNQTQIKCSNICANISNMNEYFLCIFYSILINSNQPHNVQIEI